MEINRLGDSKRVRTIIIIDTNFLIMMAKGLITPSMISEAIDLSYEMISPEAVRKELLELAEKGMRISLRRYARRALELAEKMKIKFVDDEYGNMKADDAIQALALDLKPLRKYVFVATSDRELRRRLRTIGVPSIYYRESERRLELEADVI